MPETKKKHEMPTLLNEIQSAEWSLSIAGLGEVVENFDDVNQCIVLILNTAKGSDPLRPAFGSDMWRYMDYGIDTAAPLMVREILASLGTWENRIRVTQVGYAIGKEKVIFEINWILKGNNQKGAAQIALSLTPERKLIPVPPEMPDYPGVVTEGTEFTYILTESGGFIRIEGVE